MSSEVYQQIFLTVLYVAATISKLSAFLQLIRRYCCTEKRVHVKLVLCQTR